MDAVRAKGVHAERCGDRGVDPAGDGDDHVLESALLDVVPQPEDEREAHLLELRLEGRHRSVDRPRTRHRWAELDDLDRRNGLSRAVELATPHVAETAADGEVGLDVDDEQVLLESWRASDHLARVVEHDRVSVEDELVLPTDEVAEGEVGAGVARSRHQHLLPLFRLADVEGRCGEIDDELRAGEGEVSRGRAGLPQVLADRGPEIDVSQVEQQEVAPLGEVAVLVENAVVREELLAIDRLDATIRADGAGVREISVEPGCSDQRDDTRRRSGDLLE